MLITENARSLKLYWRDSQNQNNKLYNHFIQSKRDLFPIDSTYLETNLFYMIFSNDNENEDKL